MKRTNLKAMVTDTNHKKNYHVRRQSDIVQASLAVAKADHGATEDDLELLILLSFLLHRCRDYTCVPTHPVGQSIPPERQCLYS